MNIYELLDERELQNAINDKLVNRQVHPTLPLVIFNYTNACQFRQEWNDVTVQCRGLIYDYETDEVVARPFKKFFNWDDSRQPYPPKGPVLRSPKMDGSLGILYRSGPESVSVATRGSFTSDQAQWATQHLAREGLLGGVDWADLYLDHFTYLVEIIFPENRIVVNYGDQQRLTLIDVIDIETGKSDLAEFDRVYWLDKVERKLFPDGFKDTMASDIPDGEEGFVFYWPEKDYRVKMKAAEYLELHRAIFSLSERSIWHMLGDGKTVAEICEPLPDEFHAWANEVATRLLAEADKIIADVRREFGRVMVNIPLHHDLSTPEAVRDQRKAFAQEAAKSPMKSLLFMLYDHKDITDAIWKSLYPAGNKAVTTISEDVA